MCCNYRETVGIHRNNTSINFDIPVFSLAGDCSFAVKNFLTAERNDIFCLGAETEVFADSIYTHRSGVEIFDIF